MTERHIVRAYDEELNQLKRAILKMADEVETQFDGAIKALVSRDQHLAEQVLQADAKVDELDREIDRLTVHLLARRQPMAADLRRIVASLKISSELERIADYAANIIKYLKELNNVPFSEPIGIITKMAKVARDMLKQSLVAYDKADIEKADTVWRRDDEIDRFYTELLTQLRSFMKKENEHVEGYTTLVFAGRSIERIGDHLTNICEHVYYMVKGESFHERETVSGS